MSEHQPTVPLRHAPYIQSALPVDGQWIGRYRILEVLGEGGMGIVFLAEQREPVQRMVALKLMRSTLGGAAAELRFAAERQALARLSHPNIASMYDAGSTPEGYPYFVMERVEGLPLLDYCDEHRLTLRQRIELFVQVCRGVQHAHQKGLIHRDLKPSNVLVDEVPKIIDFGIAKAIDADSTLTHSGAIGTPSYMSPEALNGDDVDTRTDVYSLGVMLYELLAGVRPHELDGMPLGMMIKLVTDVEARTPRTLYRALPAEDREQIATARGEDPHSLAKTLGGDVGWIARKATARDREERYGSAADLAADLERALHDEPVIATPPSLRYRFTKLVRRNRAASIAVAFVIVAILGGIGATTIAMVRARRAQAEAQAVSGFLIELLGSANPWNRSKDVTVRELLAEASEKVMVELRDQPAARAELLHTIGTSEFHLGHLDTADRLLREAIRLRTITDGPESALVARSQNILGLVRKHQGRLDDAESLLRACVALRQKDGEQNDGLASAHFDLATVLALRGKNDEAEKAFRESVALRERLHAAKDSIVDNGTLALTVNGLGVHLGRTGRPQEAEALIRRGLALRNPTGYGYANGLLDLSAVLARQQRWREAERASRDGIAMMGKFVERGDGRIERAMLSLAAILRAQGRGEEADAVQREAERTNPGGR